MIPIANEFKSKGFYYKLLKRYEMVAMFVKTRGTNVSYEVVRLQRHPAHRWPNGEESPAREAMPGPEAWGTNGWTFTRLHDAERRYRLLLNSATAKAP